VAFPRIDPKEWKAKTSSFGRARSAHLMAVDRCIEEYANEPFDDKKAIALKRLKVALDNWKKTQGPGDAWKKSVRNKSGQVALLTSLVEKGADRDLAPDFMHANLENSRLGVIYMMSHMKVNPKLFNVILEGGLSMIGSNVGYAGTTVADGGLGNIGAMNTSLSMPSVMVVGSPILEGGWDTAVGVKKQQHATFFARIKEWFRELARGLVATLREKWKCELPVQVVTSVVNAVCAAVLTVVQAGLVSGAIDTAKGIIVSADAVYSRYRMWFTGKGVEVADGHPGAVVTAIHRAMMMNIGEGLWRVLKGVGNLGMTAGTAGAGLIMGVVVAGAEMLGKVLFRLFEVTFMNNAFAEARKHWLARDSANALHKSPHAFGHWYRTHVLKAPALAVLTLNSGICGDKMVWLQMYKDGGSKPITPRTTPDITPERFSAGVAHLDSLKVWGAKYLRDAGFAFTGTDNLVRALIKSSYGESAIGESFAKNLDSRGAKAWDWAVRAAT
jgi:hypothetical protein